MAGYRTIYVFGGEGGFGGADGVNPIELQIWLGEGDRQWFEAKAFGRSVRALGKLRKVIPAESRSPHALLDACIAFHADAFAACPSLAQVEAELGEMTSLDFHLSPHEVPRTWAALREEARPIFEAMPRWIAQLEDMRRR